MRHLSKQCYTRFREKPICGSPGGYWRHLNNTGVPGHTVIPAKAGIHSPNLRNSPPYVLDSRLRGNDVWFGASELGSAFKVSSEFCWTLLRCALTVRSARSAFCSLGMQGLPESRQQGFAYLLRWRWNRADLISAACFDSVFQTFQVGKAGRAGVQVAL